MARNAWDRSREDSAEEQIRKEAFQPRTRLGELLWKARQEFLRSGEPFLHAADRETLEQEFHPRNKLDQLLLRAREEYRRSGKPFLKGDELEREIARLRYDVGDEG